MSDIADQLRHNLSAIEQGIESACKKAGRDRATVQLVAVTKYAEWKWVEELIHLGYQHLGESRPQQLVERSEQTTARVRWHMIGQLQRNKVRKIITLTHLIHSVDSLKLLTAVDRIAAEENVNPRVLLQVNVSGEESKQGFSPAEWKEVWTEVEACNHVRVSGLMTMAPLVDNPEDARPTFRKLKQLQDEMNQSSRVELRELSMGMSHDYQIAIEEGATLVRIGSSLFEGLG